MLRTVSGLETAAVFSEVPFVAAIVSAPIPQVRSTQLQPLVQSAVSPPQQLDCFEYPNSYKYIDSLEYSACFKCELLQPQSVKEMAVCSAQ